MSNLDFFITYCMGPLGLTVLGLAVYFIERRSQRRFFRDHPELPNPFDKPHHHPAE